jgi:hypothetical protein
LKTFFWVIAVIVSGATGFYFGIGYGAKTLGSIIAQNEVADGLARIRVSLDALTKNDLNHANKLQLDDLKSALFQIGTYSQNLAYWACSDNDRDTIEAAHKFLEENPGFSNGPEQQFQAKGLAFCIESNGG